MTDSLLAPGTLLSGRYQIADVIGQSDLSRVYLATDQRGQAQVAIKVFDHAMMARAAALSEYQAQARKASGLGVEGIARAYDFGIDANRGVPFSTAERIGWTSLDRRVAAQGPLGVMELSRGFSVLARALDAAHAASLAHRDLKPQNVFISPDNPEWVRITDFGVSALRRGAPEASGWGGPPGYTPADSVDASAPSSPSADLFALGVIAFFALTRGTPFRSLRSPRFDPNAHWSELNQPLGPLSERAREIGVALDPALDPWFARALAPAAEQRFRSAGEMAGELAQLAEQARAEGRRGPRTIPGIAAAIAQPLLFQPEPSAASLGLAPAASPIAAPTTTAALPALAVPASAGPAPTSGLALDDEPVAPTPKKRAPLPLVLGGAVVLVCGLAAAGYALLRSGDSGSASASTAPSGVPDRVTAVQLEASPLPSAAEARANGVAATATPANSAPTSSPPVSSQPTVTSAGKASTQPRAAGKTAAPPTSTKTASSATTSTKTATGATAPNKTAAGSTTSAKTAASATTSSKTAAGSTTSTKSAKKKCSPFLGCK